MFIFTKFRKYILSICSYRFRFLLLFANTGEVCVNDYSRFDEQVLVLDIETGQEKARVKTGGLMQGVVFPSAGWHRDFYWCSMDRLSRIYVTSV